MKTEKFFTTSRTSFQQTIIIFGLIAILFNCSPKKETSIKTDENKDSIAIDLKKTNSDFGDIQNPLHGIVYRHFNDVPQFKKYKRYSATVIPSIKDSLGNYKFAISCLIDSVNNILIFESLHREPNDPQSKFKILDTLNVTRTNEDEYLTFCKCRQDTVYDFEIIALVIADENAEYYDKVVRAWRADTETGKIYPIKNTTEINCLNDDGGVD